MCQVTWVRCADTRILTPATGQVASVPIDREVDPYQIAFAGSVTGLQQGSQVRYRGVPVGRVADIRIDPQRVEWVLVTIEVERGTPIRQDTVASLEMQGVTGIAFVQLQGGTQASPPLVAVVIDFDGGGRYRCELTDVDAETVAIGDRVEMTFRRTYTSGGIHNYFWKARPLARREGV